MMTESLVLALASGLAGLAISKLGVAALAALAPPGLPRLGEIAVDGRVLVFALVLSVGPRACCSVSCRRSRPRAWT